MPVLVTEGVSTESSAAGAMAHVESPASRPRPAWAPPPRWHRVAEWTIRLLGASAILAIALILVFLIKETLPLFFKQEVRSEVTFWKMWLPEKWPGYDEATIVWQPVSDVPKYGLWPLLVGTVKVALVSMAFAVPLGIGAALYVSQYARPRVREILKPAIELLAGIPSVVLGFFALIVLASYTQELFGLDSRLNALVAGIALSFAVIPVIFTISEEAFGAVPRSYVEASLALGAARYQTLLRVVVPAAAPGLAAGIALGLGRAIGETMIVLMASGNAAIASASLGDSVRTLSATIAAELAEVVFGGAHYTVLFFIGALLFVMTFGINLVGGVAIQRLRRRLGEIA